MTATRASRRSRCASRTLLAALLLAASALQAAERPRIGLVLGGGGARGGAHLGVLEVLEELHVPIDCIAGTSMGALVGGAYAAGVAPDDVKKLVEETDWISIFDDSAGRRQLDTRRKALDERFYSAIELGVSKKGLRFREGAVSGEKLKLFFNQLVRSDLGDRAIDELALPLSIIATDIGTGERVAMRTGNLTSAMRASMSVPGLIAPVVRDGRKLVDGGLTDNLPVAEVRSLCHPDVVIAVNVGSPLLKPEELTGVVPVLGQVVILLTEQNVAKSLALLTPKDVYIHPDLGGISATAFTRQLDAAAKGREAALAMADSLRRYAMPAAEYLAWQAHVRLVVPHAPPIVDRIEVARTRFVNPDTIRAAIHQRTGEPLDAERLTHDLVREFGQGDLSSLDYSVARERDRTILTVTPVEKEWGPDYLRFGLNLSSDFRSESRFNLRALYRRTWLDPLGAEWLLGAQIGSEQSIATELYQPLDLRRVFFVRPFAAAGLRKVPLYFEGDRLAVYRVQENRAGIEGGVNLGLDTRVSAGWVERHLGAVLDTGPDSFFNITQRVGGPTAAFVLDTFDQPFFPTRGMKLEASYFRAAHAGADLGPYAKAEARWAGAYSVGRWTALAGLEGGTTLQGTLPLADAFSLGGPRRLTGFANDQMLGDDYSLGRLEAQYRLSYNSPLFGLTLLAGVMAEAGRMNRPFTETSLSGWQRSLSAYLGANTFLGPAYIGVADAKNGKARFYLFIGTP